MNPKKFWLRLAAVAGGICSFVVVICLPWLYMGYKVNSAGAEREHVAFLFGLSGFIWAPLSIMLGAFIGLSVARALWPKVESHNV